MSNEYWDTENLKRSISFLNNLVIAKIEAYIAAVFPLHTGYKGAICTNFAKFRGQGKHYTYRVGQKKTAPNFSCNNFGKYGPILIMFSLLHSQMN